MANSSPGLADEIPRVAQEANAPWIVEELLKTMRSLKWNLQLKRNMIEALLSEIMDASKVRFIRRFGRRDYEEMMSNVSFF